MMPYSNGIILDNTNHYGIVKTETVFRFSPVHENFVNGNINSTKPLEWIYSEEEFNNGVRKDKDSRSFKPIPTVTARPPGTRSKKVSQELDKKHKKRKGKVKKCIFKVFKKGKKSKKRRSNRKKFMMPLILGLLAAKSLLIGIALKALAFISAKGLIMGFFSTMLASVLSLKGMFEHSHAWNRRDDAKTQVEIIQVPSKSDEHVYYDHYRRGDHAPFQVVK